MITDKLKPGKIIAVVFLTVLIWVWADLALDEQMPVYDAAITVVNSNPRLWVTLGNQLSQSLDILLKGPSARLAELKRKIKRDGALNFEFDTAEAKVERKDEPYLLELLPLIQKEKQIRELGLKVESCKPESLLVNAVALVKKQLEIRCFDEDHDPVTATIRPPQIDFSVPEDQNVLFAEVQLTQMEIDQARATAVEKKPFVRLNPDQTLTAETAVTITTPQTLLEAATISPARVFYAISPNLQGKHEVKVLNEPDVWGAIKVLATPEARQAYESMRFHAILEIYDEDVAAEPAGTQPTVKTRALIYNFPPEYVRKGEIKLKSSPVEARFLLVELHTSPAPQPAPAG